jgi:drug/metabolite transporter (DMT)-like permease/uncharacterized protein (UPF0335 family)
MGRYERRSDNFPEKGDPLGAAEIALRAVTEELQILQRNLLKSLQEDIKRLQAEKDRLSEDIKRLQEQKEQLQQGYQINEQQALIRQLSQVLATHISTQLQSSLETLASQARERVSPGADETTTPSERDEKEYTEQLLGSLDDTLTITFNSLQQELKNYQSSLSQQLLRMSVQQREGEAILIDLVNRLRSGVEEPTQGDSPHAIREIPLVEIEQTQQLQPTSKETPTELQTHIFEEVTVIQSSPPQEKTITEVFETQSILSESETPQSPPAVASKPETSPQLEPQIRANEPLQRQLGLSSPQSMGIILLVLSTVASALYYVAIKVIFLPSTQIFGVFEVQRLLLPTLGNSLLILMLRMLVVVPLMLLLAPILHSRVWQDLQYLGESIRSNSTNPSEKRVLLLSLVSGCFLFLSQLLIYLAISQVPIGMAIALLFIYPVINGLLSSFLFRDRLSLFSSAAIIAIGFGELLVLGGSTSTVTGNLPLGSIAALASGAAFAFYLIFSRICAAKLHPVSLTLVHFVTMLLLSIFGLILPLPTNWNLQLNPAYLLELVLCAFLLGVLSLFSYLLNNFGIRKIGASRSAIIGTTIPVVTGILAGLIIQETLQLEQVLGVLFVTFGAASLCWEKIRNRTQAYNNSSR